MKSFKKEDNVQFLLKLNEGFTMTEEETKKEESEEKSEEAAEEKSDAGEKTPEAPEGSKE